jgi:hypothetical protein
MARKIDGVIEAVRLSGDGRVALVRAYERRGAAFSDHILLDRQALIKRLRAGKRYFVGERIPYLAGTFKTGAQVRATGKPGEEALTTGSLREAGDHLEGSPLF